MQAGQVQRLVRQFQHSQRTRSLEPRLLDKFSAAGLRFSYTRDLRRDLAAPENAHLAQSDQMFQALFQNDPGLVRQEIVNWNLAEKNQELTSDLLPDEQVSVHLTLLFDQADRITFNNLVDPRAAAYLLSNQSRFYSAMQGREFESVSLHLGFAAEELAKDPLDAHSIPLSPVLHRDEIKTRVLGALSGLQQNLKTIGYRGRLMIETLDYQVDEVDGTTVSAYQHVTEPSFLAEILKGSGYGLLLDAAHLLISAENMGYRDNIHYVEAMLGSRPDLLHEIHIAVPEQTPLRWLDNHQPLHSSLERPETAKMLEIVEYLIQQRSPEVPVTINFETPADSVHLDAIVLALFLRDILG